VYRNKSPTQVAGISCMWNGSKGCRRASTGQSLASLPAKVALIHDIQVDRWWVSEPLFFQHNLPGVLMDAAGRRAAGRRPLRAWHAESVVF
jgi:hypothetical protein